MEELWPEIRMIADEREHVTKYVFSKSDAVAESVLYRYPDYATRTVICCSSQAGCPVGCRFCGAGDSFVRSLTAAEIVAQPMRLIADTGIDPANMKRLQIMFMSMGEPLLNRHGMEPALRRLYDLYRNAALLISTSAPRVDYEWLRIISRIIPTIGLQFSVHETTDEARDSLIPFKAKLALDEIALEGLAWAEATCRRPFFNYCAHDGNSSERDADRLLTLFDPSVWCATVSVICERDEGREAKNAHQRNLALQFGEKLVGRGFDVRVFDPAGQDTIGGGCGQLWFVQRWMNEHAASTHPTIGRGRPSVHAPTKP